MKRLKFIREYYGYTQDEVATVLNVKRQNYVEFENDKRPIPLKHLYNLCNYYKINMDYMTNLSNEEHKIICNKDIDKQLVGQRLLYFRTSKKLSQRQLAKELGVSDAIISKYENGKCLILLNTVLKLCQKYNISLDWLTGRSETMYRNN